MKNKSIFVFLITIIILNIIPSALLGLFNIPNSIYTGLYALVYVIQTALLFLFYKSSNIKLKRTEFGIVAIMLLIGVSSLIYCLLRWDNYNYSELLVSISVLTNIINFVLLMSHVEITKESLFWFLEKIVLIGIVCGAVNLLLNFDKLLNFSAITGGYEVNFSSFFPNRNSFGIMMLICCMSNQYLITRDKKKKNKAIQIFFIINLILTMSRNSIIGLLLFYFFTYLIKYFRYHDKVKKNSIIILIIASVLLGFLIYGVSHNAALMDRLDTFFFRSDSLQSGSGRFEVWDNGIDIFKKNNFVSGVGRYQALELNKDVYGNELLYFHSLYIEILVEYGILGIILLLLLLNNIHKRINRSKLENSYLYLAKSSFYVFLFISIFESSTRFSIGYADTISLIYFFSLPILIGNCTDELAGDEKLTIDEK